MKRILSTTAMVACMISAQAQTTIKGVVVDSLTNEGEPYATIRISKQNQEDKPVTMAVTDLEGKFAPVVKGNGKYTITFSSVGRATIKRNFTISGEKEIDLGTLLAHNEETMLKGIEVVAQKPIVKMEADKMTYSVKDDVESKTMTVLDMLRKVPMVAVDGQDKITVNGSSSFKIFVDGKPNPMLSSNASTILKAMPASSVSSIEVVTNPGAKYDAEGAGGVLDIKMANTMMGGAGGSQASDALNGYNGSIGVNGGNKGYGLTGYIAGQQGKFSYNANLGVSKMDNSGITTETLKEQNDGSTEKSSQKSGTKAPILYGQLAMGYEIDPLTSMNLSLGITKFDIKQSDSQITNLYGGVYGNGLSYSNYNSTEMDRTSFNGSLDYQHFFNNDRSSSLTITYQLSTSPGNNDTETSFEAPEDLPTTINLTSNSSNGESNTTEHTAQVDLVTKLSETSTLSSGVKYSNRKSSSDTEYFLDGKYIAERSSDYSNTDQIGAIYTELDNRFGSWTAKGGLRYEQTWQNVEYKLGNGDNFTKQYGNLVPSASISHSMGMGSSIGLTYNMRISRPGITYLNPYVDRSQPTSLSYGNTDLSAEKTHNISLVYSSYSQGFMWNATLKQTFCNDGIEQYSFIEDNIMHRTYDNIVKRQVTSLSLYASALLAKNTRLIFNGTGSYTDLSSTQLNRNNSGFSGNAMLSLQQTLPSNWSLTATAITNSSRITLQGSAAGMNMGMISLSKTMLDDRLSLSASVMTSLSKGFKLHFDQYTEGQNFTSSMKSSIPMTRIQASVTWKFGNTKKMYQKQHRSKVNSDYIEHQSDTESMGNAGNNM